MTAHRITILPVRGCQRSQRILEYVQRHGVPFKTIELESAQGQSLAGTHDFRASPGILVKGASVNPYEVLRRGVCRVDKGAARRVFGE
jgi:glutaredoxin